MKILTPFKSVPENYGEPGALSGSALRLREKKIATEVTAVTIGPPSVDEEIRGV